MNEGKEAKLHKTTGRVLWVQDIHLKQGGIKGQQHWKLANREVKHLWIRSVHKQAAVKAICGYLTGTHIASIANTTLQLDVDTSGTKHTWSHHWSQITVMKFLILLSSLIPHCFPENLPCKAAVLGDCVISRVQVTSHEFMAKLTAVWTNQPPIRNYWQLRGWFRNQWLFETTTAAPQEVSLAAIESVMSVYCIERRANKGTEVFPQLKRCFHSSQTWLRWEFDRPAGSSGGRAPLLLIWLVEVILWL